MLQIYVKAFFVFVPDVQTIRADKACMQLSLGKRFGLSSLTEAAVSRI